MDTKKILEIIAAIVQKIEAEKDFLTELDNEIGDGDHGINLARGFKSVEAKLPTFADKDIGAILKGVGTQLVSTVGGASGPLYGTAFMKAGNACKGKSEITDAEFVAASKAAGFENLKGHKSAGGLRASIFNAMPKEGVEALVAFLDKYEKAHK